MINLFDFTYCGDYNRQIQNLARVKTEKTMCTRMITEF